MPNGSINAYLKASPSSNRPRLVSMPLPNLLWHRWVLTRSGTQLVEIAQGLEYLHSNGVLHGNVKGVSCYNVIECRRTH